MTTRVVFIFTHRIQYFTNVLDELGKRGKIEPVIIYATEASTAEDPGFDRRITWDNREQIGCREIFLKDRNGSLKRSFFSSLRWDLKETLSSLKPEVIHLNGYSD